MSLVTDTDVDCGRVLPSLVSQTMQTAFSQALKLFGTDFGLQRQLREVNKSIIMSVCATYT